MTMHLITIQSPTTIRFGVCVRGARARQLPLAAGVRARLPSPMYNRGLSLPLLLTHSCLMCMRVSVVGLLGLRGAVLLLVVDVVVIQVVGYCAQPRMSVVSACPTS